MPSSERESALLRGVLDVCVLSLLDRGPVYGYEMAGRLREQGLPVASGSIYPLLVRLQSNGDVESEQRPSPSGPPRRWWSLTAHGRGTLAEGRRSWSVVAGAVSAVLGQEPG